MKSYGNTGTPITMDMGGWNISYREPICGGNRKAFLKEATLLQAMAVFNTLERTSGFDTPIRIERLDTFGNHTDTWTMDGRYGVPRHTMSNRPKGNVNWDPNHKTGRTRGRSRRRAV